LTVLLGFVIFRNVIENDNYYQLQKDINGSIKIIIIIKKYIKNISKERSYEKV